jgi:glycosyltransferase involved in cell wall biosynthesis
MSQTSQPKVGYVLKRYPRFSETFIVTEILAHEAAGVNIDLFSLYPTNDTHFQEGVSHVRGPVTYLLAEGLKTAEFWAKLRAAGSLSPMFWSALAEAQEEDVHELYQAAWLACEVRRRGITHLHAHFATVATSVARWAARFAGVSYSFTAHAKDIFHENVVRDQLAAKLCDASVVITVSDYNVRHLRRQFGEAAASVERVYNGLDLSDFPFAEPRGRPPRIVAVGRLIEKKGFATLVAACAILMRADREFQCDIIGEGDLESALAKQIKSLGLSDRVRLLGPLPQREVIRHVRNAAALAAPCVLGGDGNRDGLPTVLLEAMALGTPCVSTDVTGIPEVLHHEKTGLLVPQNDPSALAQALERLLSDQPLRIRLANGARQLIEQDFDILTNAAQLKKLLFAPRAAVEATERKVCV